ncbi:MAG: TolC family protein [Candidatus Omnitrophota bacterium]
MNIKRSVRYIILILFIETTLGGIGAGAALSVAADALPPQERTLTLADCYELALKRSETIAINRETIREAEAHFTQSLGLLLPHLSYNVNAFCQDRDAASATNRVHSAEEKFTLTQTLFSGFKEFAGMSGSKQERAQRVYEYRRARQLLLGDIANAFYLLIEMREESRALTQTRWALLARIEELKARERLGRSRSSEVASARAQLYGVESEMVSVSKSEALARDLLEFLTGRSIDGVRDIDGKIAAVGTEASYVSMAARRPDLEAARLARDVARNRLKIARSGFFPTVSVEGNYFTGRSTQPTEAKWDAALMVNIPLFNGTETYGAVKEAASQERASDLAYQRTVRLSLQDVRDAYNGLTGDILSVKYLTKALAYARLNYRLQKKDYEFNLVNNLEVLQAIQTLQDSRVNYIHAFYDTRRLYWQLVVASGTGGMEMIDDTL